MNCDLPPDFHPAIVEWFRGQFAEPTEPQRRGWPLISQGENTLILAPTGSGKTLAAFLAAINRVLIDLERNRAPKQGVEILYVSPLKALSYDIERNLSRPLDEIQATANRMQQPIPEIRVAVRTGDTPAQERRRMVKKPPHILITTPESLHIILTSSARCMLETVRYVIVDEIHALSPNKRGVFLSVLLERLENLCATPPVRIGLSATQKPLEETARFLGGFDDSGQPRKIEIVDAGIRRDVDLKVIAPCEDLRHPEDGSVWTSICKTLLELIKSHRSTIIFANNRRIVERLTLGINNLAGEELVQPHHGSISPTLRHKTEEALKAGKLRGVVATGTLELGIDMGAVDLVCQIESPKEVSRGIQRVGRAGHAYKGTSKGRIIPKTPPDLMESIATVSAMLEGDVEPIKVPKNCLDILAQQIVAMAAINGTTVDEVFRTIRRTYSFHGITEEAFNLTLQLVSGRYPSKLFKDLRPRVSLDRITGRISPLPGTQRLVITNGGAIPDTGEYPVYLAGTDIKLGELDEEFVYESREGDTFSLGTNNWKIVKIESDRVLVTFSTSDQARMPFWRGENVARSLQVGRKMGALLRTIEQYAEIAEEWVKQTLPVDDRAAQNLCRLIKTQIATAGVSGLPTDQRIVLEIFEDEIGCKRLAVLTTFGGRVHQALRIALGYLIKHRFGVEPESVSSDNGVLLRLPDCETVALDKLFATLTPETAYRLIIEDLPNTALFGLRFRQNAARALLLPANKPGKRTPLWLQRLKAKDLLAVARSLDRFPIVAETYRECLQDYLQIDYLREILSKVHSDEIELSVVNRKTPSPLASSMLLDFQAIYQYEWDKPKAALSSGTHLRERNLIDALTESRARCGLDEAVIRELDNHLQGIGSWSIARTAEEFYELVRRLGDVPEDDISQRVADTALLEVLLEEGRIVRITLPRARKPWRFVADERLREYLALATGNTDSPDVRELLESHIANRAVVIPKDIAEDYGLPEIVVQKLVDEMVALGELVEIEPDPSTRRRRWMSPQNFEIVYRRSLSVAKSQAKRVSQDQYSDFLTRWQHLHPSTRLEGYNGTKEVLRQLEGVWLPFAVWEADILSRRIRDFKSDWVNDLCLSAELLWVGKSSDPNKPGDLAFFTKEGFAVLYPKPEHHNRAHLSPEAQVVRDCLERKGALFLMDIVMEIGLESRAVQRALWELVWCGEVTHDYLKTLRSGKPPETKANDASYHGRYNRRTYYRLRSRILQTFVHPGEPVPGRWTLLSSLARPEVSDEERAELYARILLERYGVVAKNLVQRPGELSIKWENLYHIYQRMELAGEIERGYFVEGLTGAQFALPEAVDELLGRKPGTRIVDQPAQERIGILVNACDPVYLFGTSGPFDEGFGRLNRLPSNYAVLLNGKPVVTVELASRTLNIRQNLSVEDMETALATLVHLVDTPWPIRAYRKVEISYLGSEPVIGSPVENILRSIGFQRELRSLTLRSFV
ncbi:MAG: DEAD/DEAH box helicase [Armatimonadota bacterium]